MEVHGPSHEVFIVAPKLNSEKIGTKRNMLNVFMRFSRHKLRRAVTSFLQQVKKNRVEHQKQQKWVGSEVNLQMETEETEPPFTLQETCLYSDSNRPKIIWDNRENLDIDCIFDGFRYCYNFLSYDKVLCSCSKKKFLLCRDMLKYLLKLCCVIWDLPQMI